MRTPANSLVYLVLLLHGKNHFAQAFFWGCDSCGFLSFQLSPRDGSSTCGDCVFFWMLLFGYYCTSCGRGPTPSPIPAGTPTVVNSPTSPSGPKPSTPTTNGGTSGYMTMWTESPSAVLGSSCEYAGATSTANSASWLEPYVNQHRYCAVNDQMHQMGMGCGECFVIEYSGQGGTDPGRAGSAVIQVVDSGSAKEFDCYLNVFEEITGSSTGIFPIAYTKIPCEVTGPTAVILDGNNAWYVKVLFAGGSAGVQAARMAIGSTNYSMERVSGATWKANLSGKENQAVTFHLSFSDGSEKTITNCFPGGWPVATSSQCK